MANTPVVAFEPLPRIANPAASPHKLSLSSWLHGGPRGALEGVRVLELGCGEGENLLPLAFYDPAGTYVGLDPDEERVAAARAAATELGLGNVRFDVIDPMAPPAGSEERFDYIIVRDYLARIPERARLSTLRLCRSALAEQGLVYVDYPVAPGAAIQGLVRAMLQPLAGEGDLRARAERIKQGAASLRALLTTSEHPYPALLSRALESVAEAPLAEVAREILEDPGQALLHRDVIALATSSRLRFVCDAAFDQPEGRAPDDVRAELAGMGLLGSDQDQALDVLAFRRTRATVLCHADLPESDAPGPEALDEVELASVLVPAKGEVGLERGVEANFAGPQGQRIASVEPLLKATLVVLAESYPRSLSFQELVGRAVTRLRESGIIDEPSDEELAGVATDLWALQSNGLITLSLPVGAPTQADAGGGLHALARLEAKRGAALSTRAHGLLTFTGFDVHIVRRLAEQADPAVVARGLVRSLMSGELSMDLGGSRLTDPELLTPLVRSLVERCVGTLRRLGLTIV
ncbi:MAG: class I SAM-dependent methyltransferase [Polyangiaceae bacterium]